ncbi:hypothetical protein RDABS01_032976 [Bienertia sinuspersici]
MDPEHYPSTSKLSMSVDGDLILYGYDYDKNSSIIWSSKTSSDFNSTELVLENNGNLVIRSVSNPNNILWQSFDHPTDTWLPGAKVGFNKVKNKGQAYSWDDNSFSFEMDPNTLTSIILKKNRNRYGICKLKEKTVFSCSLDLGWYSGEADMLLHSNTNVSYVSNKNETYFTYTMTNSSVLTRFSIDYNGYFSQLVWLEEYQIWQPSKLRLDDTYCNKFTAYAHKNTKPSCSCLSATEANTRQQSTPECISQSLLQCHSGEKPGFLLLHNASITDTPITSQSGSPNRCKMACLQDCSCQAYAPGYQEVCQVWNGSSFDIQYVPGVDLYYRLAATKTGTKKGFGCGIGLIITLGILLWKCRSTKVLYPQRMVMDGFLMVYKYGALRNATKNFSTKLGEGGFGSVYKGNIQDSTKDIAVKYLKIQCQGEKQFRAEVSTLGKIHHVNLVNLLGLCIQGKKRFLVYEYMPHGSLDKQIFGDGPGVLDWRTRYQIVLGIAKGLAYLHDECRECIIHCDIKPENILLDDQFNPKIADFGLAKLLGRDFSRVLTTMRGTRGYLAPEWMSGVAITSKADVYGYGMMLFEIISGKRNWCIRVSGENDYVPLQVMQTLMNDGEVICLLDGKLEGDVNVEELTRVCRVAGWCIQENEKDRLSMMHVVRILEGTLEIVNPPMPKFLQNIAEIPEESTIYHSCTVG